MSGTILIFLHSLFSSLLVGGILEEIEHKGNNSNNDEDGISLLGPTLQCIYLEQFYKFKSGDYYFYTHDLSPHSFTKGN